MPHRVPGAKTQSAEQHQPKDKTKHRARAECQLAIASRPLTFRFIFVEVSAHAPPQRQLSAVSPFVPARHRWLPQSEAES
jgi:hypothetical protein